MLKGYVPEFNIPLFTGPVCDDTWGENEAMVFCKQLGFSGAKYYSVGSFYGKVLSRFSMDSISCLGNEKSLEKCIFQEEDDCSGDEAAGVVCEDKDFELLPTMTNVVTESTTTIERLTGTFY